MNGLLLGPFLGIWKLFECGLKFQQTFAILSWLPQSFITQSQYWPNHSVHRYVILPISIAENYYSTPRMVQADNKWLLAHGSGRGIIVCIARSSLGLFEGLSQLLKGLFATALCPRINSCVIEASSLDRFPHRSTGYRPDFVITRTGVYTVGKARVSLLLPRIFPCYFMNIL